MDEKMFVGEDDDEEEGIYVNLARENKVRNML